MVGIDPRGHALGQPDEDFLLGPGEDAELFPLGVLERMFCHDPKIAGSGQPHRPRRGYDSAVIIVNFGD